MACIPCLKLIILLMILKGTSMVKSEVRVLPSDDVTIGDFSITDFISEHGYPVETHKGIQTFDGYLLDVHRIPHGKSNGNDSRLPVVLLMHGLVGSSENWILLGPDKSLAFLLADEGYDVWMGNARGNKHSRKHINFDPDKDSQYWMFSWHEIGVYDLPAIIDYILKKTGNRKLMYVGHSQGTTTFFVMASEKPQYNRYIKVMAALAPVAFMSKGLGPLMQLVSLSLSGISNFSDQFGMTEFSSDLVNQLRNNVNFKKLLSFVFRNTDPNSLPVVARTYSAGCAIRQFIHYQQEYISGNFCQFDYGPTENYAKYKSEWPPSYDLNKITAPIALYFSTIDDLSRIKNVMKLSRCLPNVVEKYLVPSEYFSHMDFLTHKDVVLLLYKNLTVLLNNHK